MITILDETAILRYLLEDDKKCAKEVEETIASGVAYTYPEIICRVVVTLRDVYNVPHSVIDKAINMLLDDVNTTEEHVVRLACKFFCTSPLDFTDALIVARCSILGHNSIIYDKPAMRQFLAQSRIYN